jgi:aminoglycoside phosphotransferase (APT) family kinase protein
VDVDPFAILASLDLHGASSATRVTGGADTLIWRVEYQGKAYALRLFRAEQKEAARREAVAMQAAASIAPVPQIVWQGLWQERPVVLLEWCEGDTLLSYASRNPDCISTLVVEFGRLHARINALPAPPDLAPPHILLDYVQWQDPALAERLRALPASPPMLLHLDYHPLNVLTDGSRITAVIDWVNSLPGDPRADFARSVSIYRIAPIPEEALPMSVRRRFDRAWRKGYLEVAGAMTDLPLFYAIAGTAMLPEYTPRVPTPEALNPLRRWIRYWKHCVGMNTPATLS